MLEINILPQELKSELRLSKLYNTIKKMVLLVVLMTLFISILIIFGRILLKVQTNIFSNSSSISGADAITDKKIYDIEKEVEYAKKIQSENVNWPRTIENFVNNVNSDISITQFKIDKDSSQMSISGIAKTREGLLSFKKNLETNLNYSNLEFPIKDLSQKQNINFDLKMNIKFL
jgi:hypothetical protein